METIEMKLLSKDILHEYGFSENEMKTDAKKEVLTRGNFDVVFKEGNYYYSNLGIDYPLREIIGLKKLFKKVKSKNLKPV